MKRILLFVCIAIFFAACGGAGASKLDIKAGGKNSTLNVKSSGSGTATKTFTDKEGKMSTASTTSIYLASYDMDTTHVGTMSKPLTAVDQMRVGMSLVGEEGSTDKSPLKVGTYKAGPNEKYNKVDWLSVSSFADGKETKTDFDTNFSTSKITGEVKITAVTADSISGEIDVTDGDKSIKGTFTVKTAAKK
jgi:hypothetical protein